jgi:hypothetical protein
LQSAKLWHRITRRATIDLNFGSKPGRADDIATSLLSAVIEPTIRDSVRGNSQWPCSTEIQMRMTFSDSGTQRLGIARKVLSQLLVRISESAVCRRVKLVDSRARSSIETVVDKYTKRRARILVFSARRLSSTVAVNPTACPTDRGASLSAPGLTLIPEIPAY